MKRVLWMLVSLGLGLLIGVLGYLATSKEFWFLALPVSLSVCWFFVSDPSRVLPPDPSVPSPSHKRQRRWTKISP